MSESYLVIVDPQNIFADPQSAWAAPEFAAAWDNIERLAPSFQNRTIITRWLPTAPRNTAWGKYFEHWSFADQPANAYAYELTPAAKRLQKAHGAELFDTHRFGKWTPEFQKLLPKTVSRLIVTGVASDCCVLSTVLPAVDDGYFVTVVSDGIAASSAAAQSATLEILNGYAPLVEVLDTAALIKREQ